MWYNFGASRLIPVRRRCGGGGGGGWGGGGGGGELSVHFGGG